MDDADARVDTGVVQRHDLIAGQAEDGPDAQAMQRTDDQLGSKHMSLLWRRRDMAGRGLARMGAASVMSNGAGLVGEF